MGKICECLRNYCCCSGGNVSKHKKRKQKDKKLKKEVPKRSPSDKPKFELQLATDEPEVDDKRLISEAKLKEEALKGVKGGKSSYASLRQKKIKVRVGGEELKYVHKYTYRYALQLLDHIGSGNYAEVYKIYHIQKKMLVALKVMNSAKIGDDYMKNFLPNELKILREMPRHMNIIKIYNVQERWNRIWILMEFAANGTFTDYVREHGAITEELGHTFLKQILNGVHELHLRSIAHRDLKMENILLSHKDIPKISDFGYAIEVDTKNPLNSQFCGSLPYLAPEVIKRLPYNPLISDIWSLGVIFYILLNDGLPFKLQEDDRVMLEKQLKKDWHFRKSVEPKLSPDIKDIVKSMLEPNIQLRPKTQDLRTNPWFKV